MKLQITDQQLNLQLKRDEIEDLKEGFPLSVNVSFGLALAPFSCELKACYDDGLYSVDFSKGTISIKAPMALVSAWADTESNSLEFNIRTEARETLGVIIEKAY
ncbi:DUF7009 family protein [Marinoscillum sp. MHG1-6]|uniref:DUF7009 family protein n=1 Tax=Marinoscillum sp. MHG1-6 TaxID=2959627 RepID=UPI0021582254|nr:hypothetical protein [Marinoscillum sp. MHG1-6]